ncbi:truncated hemoglobin YjbI [Phyllobacterium leguminum]|uniref:Truncated hemoglobin YjbI n=2 Tax=Phyllobacterium leguminum TaxID=314237 RepID=A0A318T4H3_9HYPH|nr:truncated hemoglobin YjbI [Phyllobacterium leguminum]
MPVLSRFYARVRQDPDLGPVFNTIVEDWTEHLQRLEDFWSSLMLTSGRYKGNPVAMHAIHADKIQPHMFARWLQLWEETTNEMVSADIAQDMQAKAARIADRLNRAMHGTESVTAAAGPPVSNLLEPYRRTSIFDQSTTPSALLVRHETKAGTWAVVRVVEGQLMLVSGDGSFSTSILDPAKPGVIEPLQPHHLKLLGPVRFRLEFFDRDPSPILNQDLQGSPHAQASQL